MADDISFREKLKAFYLIATFRPKLTVGIVVFGVSTAVFSGIGVTFIVPLVEVARSSGAPPEDGLVGTFVTAYDLLGVPFTLGTIVVGLTVVLAIQNLAAFLTEWARAYLRITYVRDLQSRSFTTALDARIAYFDTEGSDDILNAIVTQATHAGEGIQAFAIVFQSALLILVYLAVAFALAPVLTTVSLALLGVLTFVLRNSVESGYAIGDRVAEANERIQQTAQAGTQGIREVRMLGYDATLLEQFRDGLSQYVDSSVRVKRNEALIGNGYNFLVAVLIFALIYVAIRFTNMSLGALGAFLFAMFKLGPVASNANSRYYQLEGMLPHLVRTEEFIDTLEDNRDIEGGETSAPSDPSPILFDDVTFSYDGSEAVLSNVSFRVDGGDFVALVGKSGAGKSTIVSLIARLYVPDSGTITAAWTPIEEYDVDEWRSRIAFVRQDPFIFNASLAENLRMANPDATRREMERVCEIAQVTEFLDDLPDGFETQLGDDGVRLSGGQRQRVALARGLLEDAAILLLDEATSDLDTHIEKRVQRNIESMDRDFTIVAIAHRLSTVTEADRILTLENGEIIERGEHDTLLEEGGKYAELYSAQ